jgi:hypothetical protein
MALSVVAHKPMCLHAKCHNRLDGPLRVLGALNEHSNVEDSMVCVGTNVALDFFVPCAGHAAAQHWVAEGLLQEGNVNMALVFFESAARQMFAPSLLTLAHMSKAGQYGAVFWPWFSAILPVLHVILQLGFLAIVQCRFFCMCLSAG